MDINLIKLQEASFYYSNAGCALFFIRVCRLMTVPLLLLFYYEVLKRHFTSKIYEETQAFKYNCGGLMLTWTVFKETL